ncbi:MAG: hypothetical protein HYZ75_05495 [Elusimicrobia bacterium]|nr:hypothetical protein [Elusimicrobiota bacterium]
MPRTILLVLALLSSPAGAWPTPPPAPPPFDAAVYIAAHGTEEFQRLIVPLVEAGPVLEGGAPRFALQDGAILDRSVNPARRLSAAEVELLLELARLDPKDASPDALKRFARLAKSARGFSALLGGPESTTVAYLDALASGAGDRVSPPKEGFLARNRSVATERYREEVPPPRSWGRSPTRPRRSVLTPAAELPPASTPVLPPAPPTASPASKATWLDSARQAAAAAFEPFEFGIRSLRARLGAPLEDPPPVDPALPAEERLKRLGELAADPGAPLDKVLKQLGAADTAALPGTKPILTAALERISKESGKDSPYVWAAALKEAGALLAARGELDGPTAVLLAETALKAVGAEPSQFEAQTAWTALAGAEILTDDEKARIEAARAALVDKTLASLLASNTKEVSFNNQFSYFAIGEPPFDDPARMTAFATSLLELLPRAPGEPSRKANRYGDAAAILRHYKALTPELALRTAEALAELPLEQSDMGAQLQLLSTDIPLSTAYGVLAADKGPGSAERLKRYEAARVKVAALHLPGALARFAAADPEDKPEAVGDLARTMFRGESKARAALEAELAAVRDAPRRESYETAPLLFAALVQALGRDRAAPLDDKTFASITSTSRALDLLRPPDPGAPADDYSAYLHGVETARNAIRASRLPAQRKRAALEDFDAAFAAAYDKGRAPADPRKAVAKLMTQGAEWLGPEGFNGSVFLDPGSDTAYAAAVRETAALFFDRAAAFDPAALTLSEAGRRARLASGRDSPEEPAERQASVPDLDVLSAAVSPEAFARASEFLSKISGAVAPPSSAHIYLESYRLGNMRSTLASLTEADPRRAELAAAITAREKALAGGLARLAALPEEERVSGFGGSRDHIHARMTGLLALSPENVPPRLRAQVSDWLDRNGPLSATYRAFPEKDDKAADGEDLRRGGAGRNVLMSLTGTRLAATDAERTKRLAGLEATLHNFARHEPALRATMHRYSSGEHPHFYEDVGNSGADALAPYYYPAAIPRVLESFQLLLGDPAVRADPARLTRVLASYKTVRDGLMREFDEDGLREPLRHDQPWFYTLLGTAAAEVAAMDAALPAAPAAVCPPQVPACRPARRGLLGRRR